MPERTERPERTEHTWRRAVSALTAAMKGGYAPDLIPLEQRPDFGYEESFVDETSPILEFLYAKYFRVRLIGIENVPAEGPALLVANHSGGLPYDGAMLIHAIRREHPRHRRLRTLVANFAFQSPWMREVVSRIGCARATPGNGRALLAAGELVGVFPEGLRGVGKLYRERYRLERFGRGGFARLALEEGVPLIPTAIVGAEEIHPVLAKVTTLAEPLGIPYIPITPTFPWLGPLGLLPIPTKWTIEIGEPIVAAKNSSLMSQPDSPTEVAEAVRERIDAMIARNLTRRRSIIFG